ncbi:uncharacterized protein LOC127005928 isoform X2 [Eriocheir sinensis]|uniref:uncharacterized protein LOC127005928 isoform X2 n=1 Tax=Eriocheir sinensis TaxID=95602 RepID=UPI0021C78E5B|nr:uncharacterized protein LOC127005928 isoform X2 [Eriocheir sinensis]
MRILAGLMVCLALAAAVPEPQGGGLFRGRKIAGRLSGVGNRRDNTFEEKPTRSRTAAPAAPVAAAAATPAPAKLPESTSSCSENVCSAGYSKYQEQCYKVLKTDTPIDFTAAQRMCQGEGAVLAADKSPQVHSFMKGLLQPHLSENVDSQYRRAFIGLMCQNGCDSPSSWLYADGSGCENNNFCDWLSVGSTNEWNALPTSLYGASIAAMLDDFPDTSYRYKLQPYPADHTLQYMICQKAADSTEHLKPRKLSVNERLSNVVLQWNQPACKGDISSYILVLLGGSVSYDTEMKCTTEDCSFTLNPEVCNYCIHPNTDYTFSVAAVLSDSQLGPAITVNKKIDVETCPNFETPFHTISTCRGVSEVIHDGSCENQITWSKGSMCDAVCEVGYGFFVEPAPKYSCDAGGTWNPEGKAPECYEIVPVFSANLQFKITYKRASIENLQHQFDGLVYKYNDIFCPYPEECGIGDLQIKSALDEDGAKMSEVIITIDTPVYNITDQTGFIELVREAVLTVTSDNAFMTLIDYDNIALVLPDRENDFKANPQLCCHTCPEGHAYRLGNCVRCPTAECV